MSEPGLRTRVLLEFGRLIPPRLEGRAVSLAADVYALGYRADAAGPHEVVTLRDQYYDIRRRLRLDVYVPDADLGLLPCVMLIHGGGWKYFSKAAVAGYGRLLASHGFCTVAVDYRLSGEARWPAQWEDLQRALAWIRRQSTMLSVNPNQIAAMGDSAGGHLAAVMGTMPGEGGTVAAVVAYYGVYDMLPLISSDDEAFDNPINQLLPEDADCLEETCRLASPLYQAHGAEPPFLLIHGTNDSVVPLAQTEEFATRLRTLGTPIETLYVSGADHMLLPLPGPVHPALSAVDAAVIDFLNRALASKTAPPGL